MQEDRWRLARDTLSKIAPHVSWRTLIGSTNSDDPYAFGTMLWWLFERRQEGKTYIELYMQVSYVMNGPGLRQRMLRFKEFGLPFPNFKPEHLENLFVDFLIDLKRTLQFLDPLCLEQYFHTLS